MCFHLDYLHALCPPVSANVVDFCFLSRTTNDSAGVILIPVVLEQFGDEDLISSAENLNSNF